MGDIGAGRADGLDVALTVSKVGRDGRRGRRGASEEFRTPGFGFLDKPEVDQVTEAVVRVLVRAVSV